MDYIVFLHLYAQYQSLHSTLWRTCFYLFSFYCTVQTNIIMCFSNYLFLNLRRFGDGIHFSLTQNTHLYRHFRIFNTQRKSANSITQCNDIVCNMYNASLRAHWRVFSILYHFDGVASNCKNRIVERMYGIYTIIIK